MMDATFESPRRYFETAASATLLLALFIPAGCRDPLLDDTHWTPDVDEFDAGTDDDAGPGELCPPGTENLFNESFSHYIGGEESVDLVVTNFSYFRCPHCAQFGELGHEIWERREDFRKRVRLNYHHFPFDNETAWKLHACAEAAGRQGMENFWAVHDMLYEGLLDSKMPSVEEVVAFVDDVLGLEMQQFDADRNSDAMLSFLVWDKSQGQSAGVTGTPSVFICGKKIGWSGVEAVVDGYLDP